MKLIEDDIYTIFPKPACQIRFSRKILSMGVSFSMMPESIQDSHNTNK